MIKLKFSILLSLFSDYINGAISGLPNNFTGNRTHYSWGDVRNGSSSANPFYSSTGPGSVSIGFGEGLNAESEGLNIIGGRGEYIINWAEGNLLNVTISNIKRTGT